MRRIGVAIALAVAAAVVLGALHGGRNIDEVGGVERELIEQVMQLCDDVQVKAYERLHVGVDGLPANSAIANAVLIE